MKEELKSVLKDSGAQCVILTGVLLMLKWLVDNWDTYQQVEEADFWFLQNIYTIIIINILGAASFINAHYGQGTGLVHLNYVQCSGSEQSLFQCPHNLISSCSHSEDAGIRCPGTKTVCS